MTTQIPEHVEKDLNDGFEMTDIDDGFQRCKTLSETTFLFRCDVNDEVFEETIDTDKINQEGAISGYYDSVDDVHDQYAESALMIIAECYFEHLCPMQLPD
jgi:hypothetical protein